jgi:hypothetical protein
MPPRRPPLSAALHRRGKRARTQAASIRAVRLVAPCSRTSPDRRSAQALPPSVRPRNQVEGRAPASRRRGDRGRRRTPAHPRVTHYPSSPPHGHAGRPCTQESSDRKGRLSPYELDADLVQLTTP